MKKTKTIIQYVCSEVVITLVVKNNGTFYEKSKIRLNRGILVEHHVKYKELHGYDETVWMIRSEHKILHNRLRLEGKCTIDLNKISDNAYNRTTKRIEANREYSKIYQSRLNYVRSYNL